MVTFRLIYRHCYVIVCGEIERRSVIYGGPLGKELTLADAMALAIQLVNKARRKISVAAQLVEGSN